MQLASASAGFHQAVYNVQKRVVDQLQDEGAKTSAELGIDQPTVLDFALTQLAKAQKQLMPSR